MSRIIDNGEVTLVSALSELLPHATAFDACVGYFNLRGWRSLRDAVGQMRSDEATRPPVRLLVGMATSPAIALREALERKPQPMDLATADARARDSVLAFANQLVWGLPNKQDEQGLRQLKRDLESGLLKVKFAAREPLHAKLYIAHLPSGPSGYRHGIVGSSNFTLSGLSKQGELSLEETDIEVTAELAEWFDDRWEDNFSIDITNDLIDVLEQSWVRDDQPMPYHVYLRLAHELSRDAREGQHLDIPNEVKRVLLAHQVSAVQVATRLLARRGIAVIGDVVGLGKTLTGTAIAATVGESVLVIAPKNLTSMWEEHLSRFHIPGKVLSLSRVITDLPELRRYKVVIIDESHNLRNRGRKAWEAIRTYTVENESKLVLLTATMFNARHKDIGGQLGLKLDVDEPLGVRPERLIAEVGAKEIAKLTGGRLDTLAAFERSEFNEDWQRLLSEFLVRRTRKYLEQTYGVTDPVSGERLLKFPNGSVFHFPKRIPEPLSYTGGPDDPNDRLATDETFDAVASLHYARYQLGKYLSDDLEIRNSDENELVEDLRTSIASAAGFIRTTALKRLTSSAHAFILTIKRMVARNYVLEHAIENDLPVPMGSYSDAFFELDATDTDPADETADEDEAVLATWGIGWTDEEWSEYATEAYKVLSLSRPAGITWARTGLFDARVLRDHVREDSRVLQQILDDYGAWNPRSDSKLKALAQLIEDLPDGEKVLVFSEYKDTIEYLAEHLPLWTSRPFTAVSGGSRDPVYEARRFAPQANADLGGLPTGAPEVDVMLATDVLSEGQNLQDAAIVVNWDLPWTTIKVIQRAGRVDRVGQAAQSIRVISFLPHEGVESVIRLFARLDHRLKNFQEILGGNEDFFRISTSEDFIRGLFDGTAVLEEEEGEVDASSYALGIWESAQDVDRRIALDLQEVVYSTKEVTAGEPARVIAYGKTDTGSDLLVMASDSDATFLTPIEALKSFESDVTEQAAPPLSDHLERLGIASAAMSKQASESTLLVNHGPRKHLHDFLSRQTSRIDLPETTLVKAGQLMDAVTANPIRDAVKTELIGILRSVKTLGEDGGQLERLLALHEEGALLDVRDFGADRVQLVVSMGFNPVGSEDVGEDSWQ